jgi:YD repeat-containing protein
MAKGYEVEVPSLAETQLTGVALVVLVSRGGHQWRMSCDEGGRPLSVRRDGKPYPTLPVLLNPAHRFAKWFLGKE